jgi:hypothetical protein
MAGGAGVSGTGVGGISVGGSEGCAGAAGSTGKEVTDMLQALNKNVQTSKIFLNFIQEISFQDIQTIERPESSIRLSKIFDNRRFALPNANT